MKKIFKAAVVFASCIVITVSTKASDGTSSLNENVSSHFPLHAAAKVIIIKKCGTQQVIKVVKVLHATNSVSSSILENEMNKVQENMSEMDPELMDADQKIRKTAEAILQTGIKL